jgi:hypothetical protein
LAWPFSVCGLFAGALTVLPLTFLFLAVSQRYGLSILITTFCQVAASVACAMWIRTSFFQDLSVHWLLLAQGVGGGIGLAIALLWRPNLFPNNHCISCGYDLTGLPHRRCPECGTENPSAPSQRDQ